MIEKVRTIHPVDFVVVDYIQRMRIHGMEKRVNEVERCAIDLADIGRDQNVIMIVLSQLAGAAENKNATDKAPIYSFFKESQAIIESADVVIALDNPERGEAKTGKETSTKLKAVILQRDGASDVEIDLSAELQYSRFFCVDQYHQFRE
jgi:replicative DNA helicase